MRRIISLVMALTLVLVFAVAGCEKRESDAGKKIKNTMDRAQDAVDRVNQRQEDSIPEEDSDTGEDMDTDKNMDTEEGKDSDEDRG